MSRLGAVADGKLILNGSDTQRTNHHGGQGIGELALEHRPFAGDHTVMLRYFPRQEWRKNIREIDLFRAFEVSLGELEVLTHHAEVDSLRAKDMTNLADHLLYAYVRSHVARAVISGEEQL